jgi:hypothetical protein
VSYEFGLIKRGLIGEIASLFLSHVSYHHVPVFGLTTWLATLAHLSRGVPQDVHAVRPYGAPLVGFGEIGQPRAQGWPTL